METLSYFCQAPDLRPIHATDGSAGLDLRSDRFIRISKGEVIRVGTGIHVEIPDDHVGLLCLRSSLGIKGIKLANQIGVIDCDYRGEIMVYLESTSDEPIDIDRGQRIVQLVVLPQPRMFIKEVELGDMWETERGDGGFGSTGEK
jgi:dUTP pyrophosphatase